MLYIRHAEKSYSNGKSEDFPLDPNLTLEGKKKAQVRFRELLRNYGIPAQIISSPYFRARETAQIAHNIILEETGKSIEISYDRNIGEYLGHQKHMNIINALRPDTLELNPIPPETWKQYSYRVLKHTQLPHKNAWYISHGIVIQSIAFFNKNKISYPSELEGIWLENNTVSLI